MEKRFYYFYHHRGTLHFHPLPFSKRWKKSNITEKQRPANINSFRRENFPFFSALPIAPCFAVGSPREIQNRHCSFGWGGSEDDAMFAQYGDFVRSPHVRRASEKMRNGWIENSQRPKVACRCEPTGEGNGSIRRVRDGKFKYYLFDLAATFIESEAFCKWGMPWTYWKFPWIL